MANPKPPISRIQSLVLFALIIFSSAIASTAADDPFSAAIRLPSDDSEPCAAELSSSDHATSCPVKCFRPDPVCGEDGVTYWCGCADARCAGAKVAKLGFCQVGNGGSAPLSAQALLLVHIVWLIVLGFSVLFGLF